MTWRETLDRTAAYLAGKNVPDAAVAAELLAARLLKCGRGFLSPHLSETPPERHLEALRRAMSRLAKGEPIQYVLGEWDFRSLTLACDRRALIPRPETEELVTRALAFLRRRPAGAPPPVVVDVGTGTGCIALSLASEYAGEAAFIGLDVSPDAVALATSNAARCGLSDRVRFVVADGLDDFDEPDSVDVIVSNPPYIPTAECASLDPRIRDWEPRLALDGGADGLDFYRAITEKWRAALRPYGKLLFEVGIGQADPVLRLMRANGFGDVQVLEDLHGIPRVVYGTIWDEI
jgi:release factor glutamine methyltransferase